MYYTIYEITNKINNKKYIGKHITKNINDNYFGSGIAIKRALKKYGIKNFEKKILYILDNEAEMIAKEKELVNENIILDNNYYNISLGGKGGTTVLFKKHPLYKNYCEKIKKSQQLRSKEISETVKKLHEEKKVGMYGKKQTENQKKIVSDTQKGRKKSEEEIKKRKESYLKTVNAIDYVHPNKGKKFDLDRLLKMSIETKNRPKKTCSYCNKTLDGANYARYNGEKCKLHISKD